MLFNHLWCGLPIRSILNSLLPKEGYMVLRPSHKPVRLHNECSTLVSLQEMIQAFMPFKYIHSLMHGLKVLRRYFPEIQYVDLVCMLCRFKETHFLASHPTNTCTWSPSSWAESCTGATICVHTTVPTVVIVTPHCIISDLLHIRRTEGCLVM